jgi:hypothetical protein
VAAGEDGGFFATWREQGTVRFEVAARRFSAKGAPMGPELRMKVGGEYNNAAGIAAYPGGFAVAWNEGFGCSGGRPDGSFGAVARFDPSGLRVGRVFRVGSFACGQGAGIARLVGSRAGALALVRDLTGYSVQRFGPSGEPVGGQGRLSRKPLCSEGRCDFISSIAMDDQGRFVVAWDVSEGTTRDFFVQAFTPRGRPMTDRIPLGSVPLHSFVEPAVALSNDGTVAVAWRQESTDSPEQDGLFVRRFRLP